MRVSRNGQYFFVLLGYIGIIIFGLIVGFTWIENLHIGLQLAGFLGFLLLIIFINFVQNQLLFSMALQFVYMFSAIVVIIVSYLWLF
ncbi:hypothetical protein [Alkalibacillus haloalkaliphilus]|uniref:Uncharacterized protein n=1 Tax=Alkalibacillus haloalkaliphilus TaxID=94136 RepID=A0A511W2T5_9BACI|nr:hypothetical protein [Alkalibacillus haloalkaliphilus]GEN45395.1 hypothetical protein AHA02nite_11710 [Alkalibacillus haloalkaliphilus]